MYKLLIAEDDPIILNYLQHNIPWAELGFTVIGAFSNGADVMHAIPTLKPDVLLTDIEMPGATGLELIQKIAEENYPVKTVVLSAYDHYQYVRSSLRAGAFDYLLKPIQEKKLQEIFAALYNDIRLKKQSWNNLDLDGCYQELSRHTAFSHVFLSYLLGNHTDRQMLQMTLDHFSIRQDDHISLASLRFEGETAVEQLSQRLNTLSQSITGKPFLVQYQKQLIFLFPGSFEQSDHFLDKLLNQDTDYRCIFTEAVELSLLPTVFQSIHTNRSVWFYLPINQIVSMQLPIIPHQETDLSFPKEDTVYDIIKRNHQQALTDMLNAFFSSSRKAMLNPDILTIHMADLYTNVVSLLRVVQPKLAADDFDDFYLLLQNQTSLTGFRTVVIEAFLHLTETFCAMRSTKRDLIDQVQEYIQQHYAEDISLSSLSETFYVTPAYLSSLFSKRTNQTITSYLQNIRLDKASDLLLDHSLTVTQIGSAVGYPSYPHFCRLFKRRFHVTPTDYRDLHRP